MLRHGGSQPRKEEGASHPARRGKNAEAFLKTQTKNGTCLLCKYKENERDLYIRRVAYAQDLTGHCKLEKRIYEIKISIY